LPFAEILIKIVSIKKYHRTSYIMNFPAMPQGAGITHREHSIVAVHTCKVGLAHRRVQRTNCPMLWKRLLCVFPSWVSTKSNFSQSAHSSDCAPQFIYINEMCDGESCGHSSSLANKYIHTRYYSIEHEHHRQRLVLVSRGLSALLCRPPPLPQEQKWREIGRRHRARRAIALGRESVFLSRTTQISITLGPACFCWGLREKLRSSACP
jgi:hypothetical protein